MPIDPNESAFPAIVSENGDDRWPRREEAEGRIACDAPGLTIRAYFAAMAMQGMLAGDPEYISFKEHAEDAVHYADALIAALNAGEGAK